MITRTILLLALSFQLVQGSNETDYRELYAKLYQRDFSYVIEKTDQLLGTGKPDFVLMGMRANALLGVGNTQEALNQLWQAYQLDSTQKEIAHAYARVLLQSGNSMEAQEVYQSLYKQDSLDLSVARPLGNIIYESGEFLAAINIYKQILTQVPDDFMSHRMLAKCYIQERKYELASQHFEIAHTTYPENANISYDYAQHEYTQGNHDKALAILRKVRRNELGSTKFLLLRADIYFKKEVYAEAIPLYYRLVDGGLESEDIYKRMGYAYFVMGTHSMAKQFFIKAIDLGDSDAATHYYLGKSYENQGEFDLALAAYGNALIKSRPKFLMDMYTSLGHIHEHQENYPQAITNFKKALELNPDSHALNYYLATVYDQYYEDKSIALGYYKKASAQPIDPTIDQYIKHRIKKISESLFFKQ